MKLFVLLALKTITSAYGLLISLNSTLKLNMKTLSVLLIFQLMAFALFAVLCMVVLDF